MTEVVRMDPSVAKPGVYAVLDNMALCCITLCYIIIYYYCIVN